MVKIEYIEGKDELLDELGFLWEKLNKLHKSKSKFFSNRFNDYKFKDRKIALKEKAKRGDIKINLVKDTSKNMLIGYSISTVDENNIGELDSLYIDTDYRKHGIGDRLIERSLNWFEDKKANKIRIGVVVGNEEVFSFYSKYGFYPLVTILEKNN